MSSVPALPSYVKKDLIKCNLLKIIHEVHDMQKQHELSFYRRPDEVRTKVAIKAKSLILVPLCSSGQLATKNTASNSGVSLGVHGGDEYFVLPVGKPSVNDAPSWGNNQIVAPFWWVCNVPSKSANMELSSITLHGVEVPIMTNKDEIAAFFQSSRPTTSQWLRCPSRT